MVSGSEAPDNEKISIKTLFQNLGSIKYVHEVGQTYFPSIDESVLLKVGVTEEIEVRMYFDSCSSGLTFCGRSLPGCRLGLRSSVPMGRGGGGAE